MKGKLISITIVVVTTVLSACATTTTAPPPIQQDADPGQALVYFANGLPGWGGIGAKGTDVRVYVDGEPVGLLPHNTYLVAQVDSGLRHIYPYNWIYFDADKTYLLVTRGRLGQWILDDPENLSRFDCAKKDPSKADIDRLEEDRWREKYAKQRDSSWRSYKEFIDRAGVSPQNPLPLSATSAWYVKGQDMTGSKGGGLMGGDLTVSEDELLWKSGSKTVRIDAAEIRQVSFSWNWAVAAWYVHVAYGDPDNLRHINLMTTIGSPSALSLQQKVFPSAQHNILFRAIAEAARLAQTTPGRG